MRKQNFRRQMLLDEVDGSVIQENIPMFVQQVVDFAAWDKLGSAFYKVMRSVDNKEPAKLEDVQDLVEHLEDPQFRVTTYNVGYIRDFEEGDIVSFFNNKELVTGKILDIQYSSGLKVEYKMDLISTYVTVDSTQIIEKV